MTDEEFLEAVERGEQPGGAFHHIDHIRMAWRYVRRDGGVRAEELSTATIRRYAVANNVPALYHDTITRFWVRLVVHVVQARPDVADFDEFVKILPGLSDKSYINEFYSPGLIKGTAARAGWVDPDLRALPG